MASASSPSRSWLLILLSCLLTQWHNFNSLKICFVGNWGGEKLFGTRNEKKSSQASLFKNSGTSVERHIKEFFNEDLLDSFPLQQGTLPIVFKFNSEAD